MANPIGALRVDLSANAAQFEKDMNRARRSVQTTTRSMSDRFAGFRKSVGNTIKSIFSFRSALIALAGVTALGFLIKKNIEAADAIAKTADRIGIGIEALQEYQHAASLAGVSNQQLEKAFTQLNRNVSQAANGLQTYARAFDMAGVSLTDHEGKLKRNEVLFEELADAIANTEDATRRADIVMTVFGRAGAQLLPLFKDGAEGIRQMRQEARDLGLVLSEDMAREAERANDQLDRMFRVLNTQLTRVVVSLAPQIVRLGEAFMSVVPDIIAFANRFLPDEFLPIEGLRQRVDEVEGEFQRLAGLTVQDVIAGARDGLSLEEMMGGQTEAARALLVELRDLDDLIKKRVRQDAMLRAEMEATGEETEATTDKVGDLREELQFELDQLQRNTTEQQIYNLARRAGVEVTDEFRATIQPLVEALEDEERATALANDAAETHQRTLDRGASVTREVRTALEIYNEEMAELAYLLEIGAINQETFSRATDRAREALEDAEKTTERNIDLARDLGMTFSSAFEDAIVGGEKLSDVLRGLEQDIIRLITRQLIIAPLADAGTNLLGDLIGAGLPSLFGGTSAPSAPPRGFAAGGQHRGGFRIVGERGAELEATGPARYYSADRTRNLLAGTGGGGDVQVNVYAPPGSSVETRESQGPGGRTLDIILDETTARNIGTPGSRTARAIRTAFAGVSPQLQGR
jgi:hypothetical protein